MASRHFDDDEISAYAEDAPAPATLTIKRGVSGDGHRDGYTYHLYLKIGSMTRRISDTPDTLWYQLDLAQHLVEFGSVPHMDVIVPNGAGICVVPERGVRR